MSFLRVLTEGAEGWPKCLSKSFAAFLQSKLPICLAFTAENGQIGNLPYGEFLLRYLVAARLTTPNSVIASNDRKMASALPSFNQRTRSVDILKTPQNYLNG